MIITGGASGLGEATTITFAHNGTYGTIADMNGGMGQELASKLTSEGHKVTFVEWNTTE